MAYSFSNKNGTTYINMDGQEYPLFNRWDNTDPMPENSTGGYFGVDGDTGYYASDVANAILGQFGLYQPTKIDSIQGWLERNKQDMASQDKSNAIAAALSLAAIGGVAAPAFMGGTAATSGGMSQAVELVKAGFPYTEAAKLTGVSEEALFAALDTGAVGTAGTAAAGGLGMADGLAMENAAGLSSFEDAASLGATGAEAGGASSSSWLSSALGTEGASLVKGLAPDLWKAVVSGIATDKQKSDFEELANKAAEMANPGAYFQRNTIWPALEEAIKAGNKPNADTLAGLHELMQSGADPNSDLRKQSANGFAAANDLVTNPMDNSGYSLADQAAQLYASLNSDPYSNPLISQTFQNAMEAAARKSAASGRLQGGNFLADSRNATTGAVVDASGKLGTQYGNAINSGMNMYDTQFKDALGLGTGAAGTANQNITAGGSGLSNLANLQQADSNYIAQLGNLAGFGKPENAAAAYAANQGAANKTDPWATALYNGGTKIIDGLLTNVFKG